MKKNLKVKKLIAYVFAMMLLPVMDGAAQPEAGKGLSLKEKLNLYADSLMRPTSFVFKGNTGPRSDRSAKFAVSDPISNEIYTIETDDSGDFCMDVAMRGPMQEVYLYYQNTVTFPVYAGDTVVMRLDDGNLSLAGTTPETSRDLEFALERYKRFRSRVIGISPLFQDALESGSIMKYAPDSVSAPLVTYVNDMIRDMKNFTDSVEGDAGPLRSSVYWHLSDYLEPQRYLAGDPLRESIDAPSGFTYPDFASDKAIDGGIRMLPGTMLFYPPYRHFISGYIYGLANRSDLNLINVPFADRSRVSKVAADNARLIRLICKDDPFLADWYLVERLPLEVTYRKADEAAELCDYLKETVCEPSFRGIVEGLSAKVDKTRPGVPAPFFTLVGKDGKRITLDDFKGKIVYLDFWSRGCGPCYAEFKKMPRLKELFKEHLDRMVFVPVYCSDDSDEGWQELIDRHGLSDDINVRIDLKNSDPIYDITLYPTYILIDAEGRMVEYGADRPSHIIMFKDNGMETALDKAIKQLH